MNKFFNVFGVALLCTIYIVSPVVAQPVPDEMLLQEGVTCNQECSLGGNDRFVCETLCGCTVSHFSKLDLSQFTEIKSQLESENVSAQTQSYLAEVGAACVAELDKVMNNISRPPVE